MGEYYAHKRNQFWDLVRTIFKGRPRSLEPYPQKVHFLQERRVALWDVLAECARASSDDSKIRDGIPNDFKALFDEYQNLRCVFFNGTKSEKLFERLVKTDGRWPALTFTRLPSSSPANASMSFDKKVEEWKAIRDCLDAIGPG